ncbi:WD40-like Beta Propeller [Fimbriimonadaceae bacterium]
MNKKLTLFAGIAVVASAVAFTAFQPKVATFLPSGWRISPAGPSETIGDLAAGGVSSPNGKWIAFVSAGQGSHQLFVVDAATGKVAKKLSLGRAWIGMAWMADSSKLVVSGGTGNNIHIVSVALDGELKLEKTLPVTEIKGNTGWLAGLQLTADEKYVVVALAAGDELRKIDLETGASVAKLALPVGSSPYQVRRVGYDMLVSLQGAERAIRIDATEFTITKSYATGRHPNDLLVQGDRLFVSCGNDDTVDIFDLYTGTREERINTRPWPNAPAGSTPHALALTADGKRLYVANSDNNCVGILNIADRMATRVEGFVPTGAYPTALGVLADGKTLLAAAGKGYGTGPNGDTEKIDPIAPKGYPYIVVLLKGLLTKVDVPKGAELDKMSKQVRDLSPYREGVVEKPLTAPKAGTSPIPSRLGDPSPIKHVLYIIKENRTYDQMFGDLKKNGKPYGNGDPKLTLFGEDIAPNHRQLAMDFVLQDNFYASGEVSVDGHHWSKGAYVPDFMQRTWPQQYSGKGTPRLSLELSTTPSGFIWDHVRRAGKTYRTYYYHTTDRRSDAWASARSKNERDYKAVDIFINEFKEFEAKKTMPDFMVMALSEDHTSGTRAGAFTPQASVASNDYGLGKLVETISKSSYWSKFAIFVLEDDAQNGPDHVDAHRTVSLVISPYTRNSGLDRTHYTTTSTVRTIELILGLQPMSQFDAAATPMYRSFHNKPDLTPYVAKRPKTDLEAKNPAAKETPLLAAIDFSEPDQLTLSQEIALNEAIWRSVKGNVPYPGAVRRFGMDVRDED